MDRSKVLCGSRGSSEAAESHRRPWERTLSYWLEKRRGDGCIGGNKNTWCQYRATNLLRDTPGRCRGDGGNQTIDAT